MYYRPIVSSYPPSMFRYYPSYSVLNQYREYPAVDTSMFQQSISTLKAISNEPIMILDKLSDQTFSHQLITAAQADKSDDVNRLLQSIGTTSDVTASYNPTGISITIRSDQSVSCCHFIIYLRWGR
ncbi:hypothetical protein [Amphibacillus cookii]|uniref:hypothetical protein n=1 Tax=Amphibacillus cookii TaxID=767787 RepID=UPI00195A3356|nr:hypothetical protein [Amphibacillus cookii]MBM7540323.1 hypothetical protein [Amphibacillus cookii]